MATTNNSTKRTTGKNVAADPTTALWRIALSGYQHAEAEYARLNEQHSAASDAYYAELGEESPDFTTYKLPHLWSRDARRDKIYALEIAIIAQDYAGKTLTDDDYIAVHEKAVRLLREFDEYHTRRQEIWQRTIGQIEGAWEEALAVLSDKRDALIEITPAPDTEAMLYKLELLAAHMIEGNESEALLVAAIRDDARRLFGAR